MPIKVVKPADYRGVVCTITKEDKLDTVLYQASDEVDRKKYKFMKTGTSAFGVPTVLVLKQCSTDYNSVHINNTFGSLGGIVVENCHGLRLHVDANGTPGIDRDNKSVIPVFILNSNIELYVEYGGDAAVVIPWHSRVKVQGYAREEWRVTNVLRTLIHTDPFHSGLYPAPFKAYLQKYVDPVIDTFKARTIFRAKLELVLSGNKDIARLGW